MPQNDINESFQKDFVKKIYLYKMQYVFKVNIGRTRVSNGSLLRCSSVDKSIRFAGVIDSNGKLLAGKYRNNIQKPLITSSSTSNLSQNSLYSGYLTLAIKKRF